MAREPVDLGKVAKIEIDKLLSKNIINDVSLFNEHAISSIGKFSAPTEKIIPNTSIDTFKYEGNLSLTDLINKHLNKNLVKSGIYAELLGGNTRGLEAKVNTYELTDKSIDTYLYGLNELELKDYINTIVNNNLYKAIESYETATLTFPRINNDFIESIGDTKYIDNNGNLLNYSAVYGLSENRLFNTLRIGTLQNETDLAKIGQRELQLSINENYKRLSSIKNDTNFLSILAPEVSTLINQNNDPRISYNVLSPITSEEELRQRIETSRFDSPIPDVVGYKLIGSGFNTRPVPTPPSSDILFQYTGDLTKGFYLTNTLFNKYRNTYTLLGQLTNKTYLKLDLITPGSTLNRVLDIFNILEFDTYSTIGPNILTDPNGVTRETNKYIYWDSNSGTTGLVIGNDISDKSLFTNPLEYNKTLDGFIQQASQNSKNEVFDRESILYKTQQLANQKPGKIGSLINQISKNFIVPGTNKKISRGNNLNVKEEEYCRVHTVVDNYNRFGEVSDGGKLIRSRKLDIFNINNSTLSENGTPIIGPDRSSKAKHLGDINSKGKQVKKYMFSIENLAWENEFPLHCEEAGPNGGRIMWFPPYNLTFSETITPSWNTNEFIGRPEPIYTYTNTKRSGSLGFKIIVDHSSILNFLSKKQGDNFDENDILHFIAGCKKYDAIDLYNDADLNSIFCAQKELQNFQDQIITETKKIEEERLEKITEIPLYFENDFPKPDKESGVKSWDNKQEEVKSYDIYYNEYINLKSEYLKYANTGTSGNNTSIIEVEEFFTGITNSIKSGFEQLNEFIEKIKKFVNNNGEKITNITINGYSSASPLNNNSNNTNSIYNDNLSKRRIKSVQLYIEKQLTGFIQKGGITYKLEPGGSIVKNKKSPGLTDSDIKRILDTKDNQKNKSEFNNRTDKKNISWYSKYAFRSRYVMLKEINVKFVSGKNITIQKNQTIVNLGENKKIDRLQEIVERFRRMFKDRIISPYYNLEYEYFDYLEKQQPFVIDTLKEKLKYFTPSFHSMTPEGMNARLTFLQQCARPGPTIKRKAGTDIELAKNVSNSVFGKPPICILRIGDFFHTKIIIEGITINYEPLMFDMNPEGIGIQPMLADVQLSISMIGGQSLTEPIEKLQNAISFNYYANTELYDPRSYRNNLDIGSGDTYTNINVFPQVQQVEPIDVNQINSPQQPIEPVINDFSIKPPTSFDLLVSNEFKNRVENDLNGVSNVLSSSSFIGSEINDINQGLDIIKTSYENQYNNGVIKEIEFQYFMQQYNERKKL